MNLCWAKTWFDLQVKDMVGSSGSTFFGPAKEDAQVYLFIDACMLAGKGTTFLIWTSSKHCHSNLNYKIQDINIWFVKKLLNSLIAI